MSTYVVNKKTSPPQRGEVYIGRGSIWGNPFRIGVHGSRRDVINLYVEWFQQKPYLLDSIHSLTDKRLVCFCHPQECHGHFLAWLVNGLTPGQQG